MSAPEPRAVRSPALLARPGARLALIVAVTLAAYATAIDNGFIWDDDDYVTQNPVLRDLHGLYQIWFEPTALPQYYPLVHTTFWVEFQLFGLDARVYHLVNVLLHAVNAWLVLRVLTVLRIPGALFAALLFAVHPVHVESVAWITERKNVLSGTFSLWALSAWLAWQPLDGGPAAAGRAPALRTFALFVAALLSKTVTCSLPAVVLLLTWWRRGRLVAADWRRTAPFFAVGLAFAITTAWLEKVHVKADGLDFDLSAVERVLIAGRAVWFYAASLAWPVDLTFNYPRWEIDAASPVAWLWPLAAAALLAVLFALRQRIGRGPLAAALVFGGSLVPALGFVDVYPMRYSFVADHFQYLASLGLLTLGAAAASRALARRPGVAVGAAAVVVVALGALTARQARIYANHETLWTDTLAKNPASWMAHNNLAKRALDRGELELAVRHLRAALAIRETFEMHVNLGVAQVLLGDLDAARASCERAVALEPGRPEPKSNLANVLLLQGDPRAALALVDESLAMVPDRPDALALRAHALLALDRPAEAAPVARRAAELNPRLGAAHQAAATAALALGQPSGAIRSVAVRFVVEDGSADAGEQFVAVLADAFVRMPAAQVRAVSGDLFAQLPPAAAPLRARVVARLLAAGDQARAEAVGATQAPADPRRPIR